MTPADDEAHRVSDKLHEAVNAAAAQAARNDLLLDQLLSVVADLEARRVRDVSDG